MSTTPAVLWWGEGKVTNEPAYWAAAAVASDDGVPFGFDYAHNSASPQGLGGECLFTNVYVSVWAAAGTTLQITPVIDDVEAGSVVTPDGSTIQMVTPSFVVPQQAGGPPIPLQELTVQVPLLFKVLRGGVVQYLTAPRGGRCFVRVQNVAPIGTGSFRLASLEIEYVPIRSQAKGAVTTV